MCFAPQRRALFRHLHLQKWSEHGVFCTFWLGNVLRATRACAFSTSQLPRVVQHWGVLCVLTSKCASCHKGVHFFDIATSKSGPTLKCFIHFDFEICFPPQGRALFQHLNFQKWSEPGVFCTFWLRNVLRATTACTFSTSQLPKVVRHWSVFIHFDFEICFAPQGRALVQHLNFQKWSDTEVLCAFWLRNVLRATTACTFSTSQLPKVVRAWCALCILTWKCASLHNGVQFFISHLASWLRTRRLSEPTFRPSGASNHRASRLSYLFAHLHLLSSDSFSSLIFSLLIFLFSLPQPCSAFHLSILSEVWLLNFLRLYIIYYILYKILYII